MAVEAEAFEAAGAQLIEQRRGAPTRARTTSASIGVIGRPEATTGGESPAPARRSSPARHDDLARAQHGELVGERLHAVGAGVFRGAELAGRQIEQRDADASPAVAAVPSARPAPTRHQERRLARVEIVGVGQRAGRDDADDLALDDPLGLARILDLVADGDAEAAS